MMTPVVVFLNLETLHGFGALPYPTSSSDSSGNSISSESVSGAAFTVVFVSSEDFEDSEVAQAVGEELAAVLEVLGVVLVVEVATPEVALLFLHEFEH